MDVSLRFSAKEGEAAPTASIVAAFRRRFFTTVLPGSRLVGVVGGSSLGPS